MSDDREYEGKPSILEESPHDQQAGELESGDDSTEQHWVPSRYNVRALAEDGRLIIWNTLRGSMSVFKKEQAPQVVAMLARQGFRAPRKDLIGYLATRGILIRQGTNEYRQFQMVYGQQQHRPDTMELILLASEDCNFRCRYCYEQFTRGTMHPQVRQGIKLMAEKRFKQLRNFHVEWFGGEPLYGWSAIEELAPWFHEETKKHGIRYSAAMTTNGYLLTPERAEQLLSWRVRHFQITLDGPAERHNLNRPARDGKPTFERIFANLKSMAARKDDFSILLRVNFDPGNQAEIPKLMDQVREELGTDDRFQFHFHPVGHWGGENDKNVEVCGTSGFDVQSRLKAQAAERGLHFGTLRTMNLPGSQVCYAARPYNVIIGASGKVMKCTVVLDTDERNVVGHITPEGDLIIDSDRMGQWTEPAYERDTQCQKCVMLPNCQGISCPLVRIQSGEQPCVPTRRYAKRQMLEALRYHENCGKPRQIPMLTK